MSALTRRHQLRAITITATADSGQLRLRLPFLSPADGIPEDPVTGSAHLALAPYWTARLGRNHLTGLQASARSMPVSISATSRRPFPADRSSHW
jgi:predicted PhzF superfamily epimerase YddE/YHI9